MSRVLQVIAFWAIFVLAAAAQELGPEDLVKKVTQEVLDAIKSDKQLAAGDKRKAIKLAEEKVLPHVDFEEATRLAVGRSWAQATPEQRKKLVTEFRNMLVRTYSNAITAYEGQTMKVMPVRMKPGDTDVTVHNQFIRPGGKPVLLDYSMRKTDSGWKIYDIVVEGVSLVLTYRSEFDAVVKQEGIDGLIKRLAQKNTPAAAGGSK
ncbi:MAG TPA: ABC transporter substrate-binding protein [Terriglobales bacterium]|jgi:phospholipid transport system substrate-binding protein|nr:ABC transporter substrate-binding protein [Burkholderiales bacterium]HSE49796.1 ABC transporter substrate-binding protein [Terriglobales bacterium]